jgi:hypothetical protein
MGLSAGTSFALSVVLILASACTSYESEYEKSVYDHEPVYCYQTLGGVDCHRTPHHRDGLRLVNYYGPAPSKYAAPDQMEIRDTAAPPRVEAFDRDPEPDTRSARSVRSASAPEAEPTRESDTGTTSDEFDWRSWLPLLSVAFGAMQAVAAFAL